MSAKCCNSGWVVKFAFLSLGVVLLAGGAAAQEPVAPPLWSGEVGNVTVPVSTKIGEVKPGDLVAKAIKKARRTARLTADYSFGDGYVIPAGSPFFAARFFTIQRVGSAPLPPRRKDDVHWCAAAKEPPIVCFRWNGPGQVERAGASGAIILERTPGGRWIEDREPALKEQPVVIDPPYEETQTLKAVTDEGVIVRQDYSQGEGRWGYDKPTKWGEKVRLSSGVAVVFEPMRDPGGALIGARITPAKP